MVRMETVPLTAAKAKFSHYVDRVADQQDRVVVTRNGKPAAVLINPEDLESLEETLEILSDETLLAKIEAGLDATAGGETVSADEARESLGQRRR